MYVVGGSRFEKAGSAWSAFCDLMGQKNHWVGQSAYQQIGITQVIGFEIVFLRWFFVVPCDWFLFSTSRAQ